MSDLILEFPNGLVRTASIPDAIVIAPTERKPSNGMSRRKPSLLRQAWTYAQAIARWNLAGKPTRTQAEIDAILATCEACPYYKHTDRPRCGLCGCSVNNQPNGLANKIAMATESCPLDPPKWSSVY